MTDNLTKCAHCGGDACYETDHTFSNGLNIKSWMCMGCGFTTNTTLIKDSDELAHSEQFLPELYKDLKFVDADNRAWFPSVINLPENGIVFVNGTSKEDWGWSGIKAVPVNENEKEKYPIPGQEGKFYDHKTDMESLKTFDKKDFMEACDYIGIFKKFGAVKEN